MIGMFDGEGGPLECSDWLGRLSWWAWLAARRMSVRICPGGVWIVYIRRALTGSSSLDAAPVTGSLLFRVLHCRVLCC